MGTQETDVHTSTQGLLSGLYALLFFVKKGNVCKPLDKYVTVCELRNLGLFLQIISRI